MYLTRVGVPVMLAAYLLLHPFARGADFPCPPPSEQKDTNIEGDIEGKAQTLLKIGTAELKGTAKKTVVDLFSAYPNADRVAIINSMLSTTCNLIRTSKLSDTEKLDFGRSGKSASRDRG